MHAMQTVDVARGVDFEIARSILNDDASSAFRTYIAAKRNPAITPVELEGHRSAYREARDAFRALRPDDHKGIRDVVGDIAL